MRLLILTVICTLVAGSAMAQVIDQCSLVPAPGPLAPLIQKLECRLQIEDNARMEAEENLIIAQADQKIAEGKIRRIEDDTEKKLVWWQSYEKGISTQLREACKTWYWVQDKAMARLCHIRH